MRGLSLALCLLAAGPASALSCVAPDVGGTYFAASDSPDDYVIALGYMSQTGLPEPQGSEGTGSEETRTYTVAAQFIGHVFSGAAFDLPRDFPVTVEVTCVGPWCGGHGNVENGLFFLRRDGGARHVLQSSPCRFWYFPDPTAADIRQVVACHRDGGC